MKVGILFFSYVYFFLASSFSYSTEIDQNLIDEIAEGLKVKYVLDGNFGLSDCSQASKKNCFRSTLHFNFPNKVESNEWRIYFSHTLPILWSDKKNFSIEHLNGDLHVLTPLKNSYNANDSYRVSFSGIGAYVSELEIMPNYIIAAESKLISARTILSTSPRLEEESGLKYHPHVAKFEKDRQVKVTPNEGIQLDTPGFRYNKYSSLSKNIPPSPQKHRFIPQVLEQKILPGTLDLSEGVYFSGEGKGKDHIRWFQNQLSAKGIPSYLTADKHRVGIFTDKSKVMEKDEFYTLVIDSSGMTIEAGSINGEIYALATLYQMIDGDGRVPLGVVHDGPRYEYRGVHIDVARNFHSKKFLLSLISQMALLKLNTLHIHLADDEGWRLEIEGLAELTDTGANKCFDLSETQCLLPFYGGSASLDNEASGYYSKQDYIEILQFAGALGIEVVPSFDMPGHSRAAIKSMEARYRSLSSTGDIEGAKEYLLTEFDDSTRYRSIQDYSDNTLNPCMESTYRFFGKVLSEVAVLHKESGFPLLTYHIGADETAGAWKKSPVCHQFLKASKIYSKPEELASYFIVKVVEILRSRGIRAAAWSDGLSHIDPNLLPKNIQAYAWELLPNQAHNQVHDFVNQGWDVVLSLPDALYFDFPYAASPKEQGNGWGSRYVDTLKVFQFMPDNLPAHASIWTDVSGKPYKAFDTVPLRKGQAIKGIQAQLWSESTQTDRTAGYMYFPRLIAFAERAWHKAEWEPAYVEGKTFSQDDNFFGDDFYEDWQQFASAMPREIFPQLHHNELFYRLPLPGAKYADGLLDLIGALPGLEIEFKVLQNKQDSGWKTFKEKIAIGAESKVYFRHKDPVTSRVGRSDYIEVSGAK